MASAGTRHRGRRGHRRRGARAVRGAPRPRRGACRPRRAVTAPGQYRVGRYRAGVVRRRPRPPPAVAAGSAPAVADRAVRRGTRPHRRRAPPGPRRPPAHADPLSVRRPPYVAGRSGTVLAAVYDVRTGQSWRLGDGPAQAEASVVKLDILETLLARQRRAALSPADQSLAQSMIEDSDNDAATSLWDEAGRPGGPRRLQRPGRADQDDPVGVRDVRRVPLAGLGADHDRPVRPAHPAEAARHAGAAPAAVAGRAVLRAVPDGERHPRPALGGLRRRPGRGDGGAEERLAAAQRREHRLAGQQRRLGLRRRPRLPDRRASPPATRPSSTASTRSTACPRSSGPRCAEAGAGAMPWRGARAGPAGTW